MSHRPPQSVPRRYQRAASAQLRLFDRVTERDVLQAVTDTYAVGLREVLARAREMLPSDPRAAARVYRARVAIGLAALQPQLADTFFAAQRTAAGEAVGGLYSFVSEMEPSFRTVATPEHVDRVTAAYRSERARAMQESLRLWRERCLVAADEAIRKAFDDEAPLPVVLALVDAAVQRQAYILSRAARTSASYTANAAIDLSIAALTRTWPDVRKRWTERVNDANGHPLDEVVGADSMALHAQTVLPSEAFVMPPDELVSAEYWGLKYTFPPNRPNDRATVLPWRPSWKVPAWRWDGHRRVYL